MVILESAACAAADHERVEVGFTLIEMMVVLLVIAILLAIAIPTFLGSKTGSQDRSTESNLSNALMSAKSIYANSGSYPDLAKLLTTMNSQEPNLSFVKNATSEVNEISTNVSASGQQIVLVGYSASGTCWALSSNNGGPPNNAWGQAPIGIHYVSWNPSAKGGKACNAANAFGATEGKALADAPWSQTFPTSPPTAKP
jgi:type IV pilus assembly protein PilA